MFPSSIEKLKNNESPQVRFTPAPETPHRVAHGSTAWAVTPPPAEDANLYQPQDGAGEQRRRVTDIASRLRKISAGEPEDARLTGGTRSLMRRLSGLNMIRSALPIAPKPARGPRLSNVSAA
jgi:hypothetical protein